MDTVAAHRAADEEDPPSRAATEATAAAVPAEGYRGRVAAVADALVRAGIAPTERWDEARGTAWYWVAGDPALGGAWQHGIVLFWEYARGWRYAPLTPAGDPPAAADFRPFATDPAEDGDALAGRLVRLLADGPPDGRVVRRRAVVAAADPLVPRLVEGWLLEYPSPQTRRAYGADLRRFAAFLAELPEPVGLLDAGRAHAAAWAESMRRTLKPDGSRRISEATIARRLAVASSFYTYAVDDDAVPLADNPVAKVRRPKPDQDGDDIPWLDAAGAKALLAAAAAHSPRAHALVAVMLTTGARVSEVLGADARDLRLVGGHRVLAVTRKGGRTQYLPIAPWVGTTLDDYVAGRDHAPLFATRKRGGGHGRWDEPAVWRLIRLLARRAGLDPRLRPHSLRHTAITMAIETAGLRRAQVMAGHASASTTERYDRARERLDSSPVYALAARLAD